MHTYDTFRNHPRELTGKRRQDADPEHIQQMLSPHTLAQVARVADQAGHNSSLAMFDPFS